MLPFVLILIIKIKYPLIFKIASYKINLDKDNQFLKNDSILIVDQEERMALRQSKARKKRKHKRVEKVEVDPEWFEKLMKKN